MVLLLWGSFRILFFKKILDSWIKSEARKSFQQRRLQDDGNWNAAVSKLVFFNSIQEKKMSLQFCQQVRPTRQKHTPANARVFQSKRCAFHAEGTSRWVLEMDCELSKLASHSLTKFNSCRVRLIRILQIRLEMLNQYMTCYSIRNCGQICGFRCSVGSEEPVCCSSEF